MDEGGRKSNKDEEYHLSDSLLVACSKNKRHLVHQHLNDIVLIGDDPNALELSLKILRNAARTIRLKIHTGKTKWMKNTFTRDYCLRMESSVTEEVSSYVYLGQADTMDNVLSIEIGRRRRAGWATFNKFRDVLTDKRLEARIKAQVFNTHVLLVLVYGSELWRTIKDEERKLASTQRAMERAMSAVTLMHKIPASEIRRRTCAKDRLYLLIYNEIERSLKEIK
ncbi:hypothetical protein TELCIR_05774 [Teladorsagia circumcincta]|uniref:Reverse transcriptase domain-containing protein n=1 Tax=Teladorsagia circumcincta TaxID=45464 RepID=A0A2G9UQ78_TELCI|nr:hypothetical protein TELCIR_05774 [Teladorsagia circumcincta]